MSLDTVAKSRPYSEFLKSCFLMAVFGISFAEKVSLVKCPGMYCGRKDTGGGTYSECGACPRGYQPDPDTICQRCEDSPKFYDWLYLGFMALLSLVFHWFFIDFTNKRKRTLIILHASALVECILAAILTLLLVDPVGSINIRSCMVHELSDWYTMLYNPSPNYTTTLHCTQEIVYPLYTISMIYYAFCLLLLMLVRPFVSYTFVQSRGTKSIYAALYFLPILIVLQAVFGGLLYYAFPYIVIVISIITNAVFLSSISEQEVKPLLKEAFLNLRNLTILAGHWFLHAYGIIAMTQLNDPRFYGTLIALVPFPVLFYILTVKFTDPDRNVQDMS
ncbi:JNK1/MAPK8-associated membrane protein-like [Ylistrum balloti]|uniref:JNK1/MAPK8-associated membrane protein-like n=1 Tax=Ylistrum balloti TaxID=509963 RepID=UPI002905DE02|nr:JNK1/MAPK8-associated membrane protein-like [Ylistrum balloti]